LRNGVVIAIHPNSFRTVRGHTCVACIFDEVSFWRDETTAQPDVEVYTAIKPTMATTDGMLIAISTPYRKMGLMYQKWRDYFGVVNDHTLVLQGTAKQFNPELDDETIAQITAANPAVAPSEWDAIFRTDIGSFFDDALIDVAIDYDRPLELPPMRYEIANPIIYQAFTDSSGRRGDAYTLCIGHKQLQDDTLIIDLVRAVHPPFDPEEVTKTFAALCRDYRVTKVVGDYYGAEWVASAWQRQGITYVRSSLTKSQIYLESLPLFTRGLVRLPDHPTLLRELRLLERRANVGGKETIDHGKNGHDDCANVVCGVLRMLGDYNGYNILNFEKVDKPGGGPRAWTQGQRLQQYIRENIPVGASGARMIDWSRM
jgi:hypothetical protein